jgi:hypothetical protein
MTESKKDAWERPVLRRLDASDAQDNDNMMNIEQFNAGPHPGTSMTVATS